jgi:superfamily I DNA/RNA helicase
MTFDLFEGAAGTGKTHNLVIRASEHVHEGLLGEDRRALALTFMNGSRRRLEGRLGQSALFRRRFQCQTFDVFARTLVSRRKSLLSGNVAVLTEAAALNEFDGPCFLAGRLLEKSIVQKWVAASFPLILVDEAQDLDRHRATVLQGLAAQCSIVAAADAFQCLVDGRDTSSLMSWLEGVSRTRHLTHPRRTSQLGLLAAAGAIRNGQVVTSVLTKSQKALSPTWSGQGFRLLEIHAKNAGLVAWAIANEMAQRRGQFAILTPDSKNSVLRAALDAVSTRSWNRKNGQTFGPFPISWELEDAEVASALITGVRLPPSATYADCCVALSPIASHAAIAQTIARMDRLRRVCGLNSFTATQVSDFVQEAVRDQSRLGFRQQRGNVIMTIQRAKNREFQNVIVLWPHTATGSAEHLRRLLYNAVTRAIGSCTVIVLGMGRLSRAPFA